MTAGIAILLVVLGVLVVAGGAIALALSSRRDYRAANQVVPGISGSAPPEWAGAHTQEARLHRRLRAAVQAVHAHPRRDDPSFLDQRVGLEQQALAVDEQLIAVAALPAGVRAEPLAAVDAAVAAVESAVAALATALVSEPAMLEQSRAELAERFRSIEQARDELGRLTPPAEATDPLAPTEAERTREDPEAGASSL